MTRIPDPPTTGKSVTDPPPYFLHPTLPPLHGQHPDCPDYDFQNLYDLMNASGTNFLRALKSAMRPPLRHEHIVAAYSAKLRPDKSPLESIKLPICKQLGIGPIRMVYFRELLYGHYYQEMLDGTYWAGTSFFVVGGKRRDAEEWLTMDRYLGKTLMSLGLSWWMVEEVIAHSILGSGLPEAFKEKYGADPASTEFVVAWEQAWRNRKVFKNFGNKSRGFSAEARRFIKQGEIAEKVEAILTGKAVDLRTEVDIIPNGLGRFIVSYPTDQDRILNEIIGPPLGSIVVEKAVNDELGLTGKDMRDWCFHKILLDSRDLTEETSEGFDDYSTAKRSPLIQSVIFNLGTFIWKNISINHRPRVPASSSARRLLERKQAWQKKDNHRKYPNYYTSPEFFMLISELLYHCPVLSGLPDAHIIKGSVGPPEDTRPLPSDPKDWPMVLPPPPMWEGLTADQVRQRFGEEYRRYQKRKKVTKT